MWEFENKVVLVGSLDAGRLCRDGEYEAVDPHRALWDYGRLWPKSDWQIRDFVARAGLSSFPLSSLDDYDVNELIENGIRRGELVAIKKVDPAVLANRPVDPAVAKLSLIRQIEAKAGGKLTESGRQYRLIRDIDFEKFPERNYYHVVRQDEAKQILDALAKQPGTSAELAELLVKARDQLTRDWNSFGDPDGLILLRRVPMTRAPVADTGPALTPSQLRKLIEQAALEILVVDLDKTPQEGLAYRIKAPDGNVATGKLDKEGRARVKSSTVGVFTVAFPDLDGADWDGDGAMELPPEETRAEASRHQVAQGERLATIASQYAFACWQTVWNFKGNQEIKDLREDPNILFPGDEVVIPTKLKREAEVPGGTATYVVNRGKEVLRVCFAVGWNWDENPVSYTAKPDTGGPDLTGPLDSEGWMEIDLPPNTSQVDVALWIDDPDSPIVTYALRVGELDPTDEVTGVQARLANLGYYDGAIDGDAKEVTAAAIAQFRREQGLPLGDQIDDDLREALEGMYGADEALADTEADQTFSDDDESADTDSSDATEGDAADQAQEGEDNGNEDNGEDDGEDDEWIEDDEWDGDWEEEDDEDDDSSDSSPQE
jgi:N-acetylmuramoyl-L-alanine amidase